MVQPLVARLFGLAALRIDVGGQGSAKSIEFARHRAYQLRDYLISRAHGTHITVAEFVQRPVGDVMAVAPRPTGSSSQSRSGGSPRPWWPATAPPSP